MMPRLLKAVVSLAVEDTKRRSQFIAATIPMPAHAPLIAAMTGLRMVRGSVTGVRRCGKVEMVGSFA